MTERWSGDWSAVRGLLFDKDGALFDFEATWGAVARAIILKLSGGDPAVARALAERAGYDPATGGFRPGAPGVAGSIADVVAAWSGLTLTVPEAELEIWLAREGAALSRGVLAPASANLGALLGRLSAVYALGVATNDAQDAAEAQLAEAGVAGAFQFVVGYDSGLAPKPDPAMLLAFASTVDLPPSAIAMIGDSPHDLKTARAAGAAAIGVLTGPAEEGDLAPDADVVLPSIDALPALLGV